ncbi:B3 domain-containing protein Os02g0598200-like isoform X2 [Salvia miltiorrhiza]|uniref:B3 domain-containing protein Os02g0598200-like isoform X2 n=1 Tax=Salvia miltiorrhiza TaxID=226208 RepID=UPI0025AD01C5|nr:B3 domain-containing protein Os02g0598200-like isoform X2 [Salvia miltiorrhiza]
MVRRGCRTSKHESSHRFFKVMFGKNHSKFMYLPPKFAQRVKHLLTNQKTELKDSLGQRWSVTLSLVDGALAFQMGWEEFYLYHGLKEGQLLLFKYKESHFTVRIFGTSACERTNFNNEMPGRRKKRKRCQGTTSEDEAHQTAGVKSDISISASGDESQNRITKLAVDLSFEMENGTFDAKKAEGAVIKLLDASTETEQRDVFDNASDKGLSLSSNWVLEPTNPAGRDEDAQMGVIETDLITRTTGDDAMEQTKTTAEDAQMGVIETDLITSTTGDDAMEQTKTSAEDAQMGAMKTNLITSNTGDISIDKFVTASDAKTAISHTEITDQIRKKVGGTQMTPHSHQAGGHSGDAFMKWFYHEKPSDDNKMKKIMLKNEPFSLSPSIGGSKISEGGHVAKSKFGDSFSSATFENPLGLRAIKKEVKMEDTANVFHQGSCGKELPPVCNQPQMISPLVVKVEPDLPYETGILDTISSSIRPFSAEVESQSLLVVPQSIGRRLRGQTVRGATVVFLRDSVRRLWPVVFRENAGRRALTINWTEFCEQDNVKPGDKCEFQVENDTLFVYRVDVARGSS